MIKYDILTYFPEMFSYLEKSIIGRAQKQGLVQIKTDYIRDFAIDKHGSVDDSPYGGGVGMIMRADVVQKALKKLKKKNSVVILMSPQGQPLKQELARQLAEKKHLVLICGRYEGYDERIRGMVDMEVSAGDYVLTGGELPAMILIDATARLVPGVLGKEESLATESFDKNLLEYPQYTRPEELKVGRKKMAVPKVLLSGNHAEIAKWRQTEAEKKTKKRRPDLLTTKD